MGAVFRARQLALDRRVAVKVLPIDPADPDRVKRLVPEARAIAKLDHPNIVQVYDVGREGEHFYIVMQLLEGETLKERFERDGALPRDEVVAVARGVAEGLSVAHEEGVIHRDLKLLAKLRRARYASARAFLADFERCLRGEAPIALETQSGGVRCPFCDTLNAKTERRCRTCKEPLGGTSAEISLLARPDEFSCPACGGLATKGSRACPTCGKGFCSRCRTRLVKARGLCEQCLEERR